MKKIIISSLFLLIFLLIFKNNIKTISNDFLVSKDSLNNLNIKNDNKTFSLEGTSKNIYLNESYDNIVINNWDTFIHECIEKNQRCDFESNFLNKSNLEDEFKNITYQDKIRISSAMARIPSKEPKKEREIKSFFEKVYSPNDPFRYRFIGQMYFEENKLNEAKPYYDKLSLFSESEIPLADLAVFYYEVKDFEQALKWEEKLNIFFNMENSSYKADYETIKFHQNRIIEIKRKIAR